MVQPAMEKQQKSVKDKLSSILDEYTNDKEKVQMNSEEDKKVKSAGDAENEHMVEVPVHLAIN